MVCLILNTFQIFDVFSLFLVYSIREAGIENLKKLVEKFSPNFSKWGEVILYFPTISCYLILVSRKPLYPK